MSPLRLLPVLFLIACAPQPESAEESEALASRRTLDSTAGAMIVGSSADRRRIVYGTDCDSSGSATTALKVYDDHTGRVTRVATGVACMPGSVVFSPDGKLMAFGDGMGLVRVWRASDGRVQQVSRAGLSGIGVAFSPDSRWLVVASLGEGPGAALDAWDANLTSPVEISASAFWNPFDPSSAASVRFSPDGARLLFLTQPAAPLPVGTLSQWAHASHVTRTVATGVPITAYLLAADWSRIALLQNATVPAGGSPLDLRGDLVLIDLATLKIESIAGSVTARPLAFAGDTLLYLSGSTLIAYDLPGRRATTVDTNLYLGYGPRPGFAVDASGERAAYGVDLDPMSFTVELRVASLCGKGGSRSIAKNVVPMSFDWAGAEASLVYLHDSASSFPGNAQGTLTAWNANTGTSTRLGTDVAQVGLRIPANHPDILFVSAYDAQYAAGNLRTWNARTGAAKRLGRNAAAMSISESPNAKVVGFLSLIRGADDSVPPGTRLWIARVPGSAPADALATDVTSLAVTDGARAIYTTASGLFKR